MAEQNFCITNIISFFVCTLLYIFYLNFKTLKPGRRLLIENLNEGKI